MQNGFCRTTGKKKLCKADLEGPAFNLCKERKIAFIHIQAQSPAPLPRLWPRKLVPSLRVVRLNANIQQCGLWHHSLVGLGKESYINKHSASTDSLKRCPDRRCEFSFDKCQSISKNLHPNDFEDLIPFQYSRKSSNHQPKYQTRPFITQQTTCGKKLGDQESDVGDFLTITSKMTIRYVPKPRRVVYRDRKEQRKLMRLNELHKWHVTSKWVRDDKRRSKRLHHSYRGKDYRSKDSIAKSRKLHPSETIVFHNEDGNPARANIKQALGYIKDGDGDGNSQPHKGVQASASSDVMYSFTSAQYGDLLQDDVRFCLGNDLKKAQDHSQRQARPSLVDEVLADGASWSKEVDTGGGCKWLREGGIAKSPKTECFPESLPLGASPELNCSEAIVVSSSNANIIVL
ncbi:hypothetical protein Tco_0020345 [Tanacetum coccineum]